ncbi:MAG: DUF2723 domain-containing protein [Pirellulales bacterium]|nr:DUF2723 domain-containing protein [Pirellulales bacterium]
MSDTGQIPNDPPSIAPEQPPASQPTLLLARDGWTALGVGLVALVAYVPLLAPGLLRADMGELQTLAVTLGYAHPTGYPVYLLVAKAATAIPVGDVPYRVNLLSALMGAVAAALVVPLGTVLTGRRWIPIAGGLALAFSPTFWSQAIIAEVYTTAAACTVLVLLGLALWQQTGRLRWLFAGACVGGVSLGIHTTVAFMAPAAVLFVLLHRRRWKANLAAAVAGAATGAAITLAAFYVIDRADSPCSYFRTVINPSRSEWNLELDDTDDFLERVWLSITAPQFQGKLTSQPLKRTAEKAQQYLENLPREFPPLWLAAAVAGVWRLLRQNAKMSLLLTLTYLAHLVYDLQFDGIVHVMYISTYVLFAVFGTVGLAWASDGCRRLAAGRGKRRWSAAACDGACAIAAVAVVVWPMLFAAAWDREHRRAYWVPPEELDSVGVEYSTGYHRDVRELLGKLEDDAVVFTGWCHLYPYYYVALVEQGRTGMEFYIDYVDGFNHPELADSAVQFVRHIKQTTPERPIYFTHIVRRIAELYEFEPAHEGLERLYRVGKPIE